MRPCDARERARPLGDRRAPAGRAGALSHEERSADRRRADGEWIELDFPVTPEEPVEAPPGLIESIGVPAPRYVGEEPIRLPGRGRDRSGRCARCNPISGACARARVRGVIVTSRASTAGVDFVSRFFAPQSGIDEDPVTGSAHCCLAHVLESNGWGRTSSSRTRCRARRRPAGARRRGPRLLGGQAVTVLRGELVE